MFGLAAFAEVPFATLQTSLLLMVIEEAEVVLGAAPGPGGGRQPARHVLPGVTIGGGSIFGGFQPQSVSHETPAAPGVTLPRRLRFPVLAALQALRVGPAAPVRPELAPGAIPTPIPALGAPGAVLPESFPAPEQAFEVVMAEARAAEAGVTAARQAAVAQDELAVMLAVLLLAENDS